MRRSDKPILYLPHADQMIQRRGISKTLTTMTVRNSDTERPARRADARRFEKKLSRRRRLVVIAVEHRSHLLIITAFWM